MKTRVRVISSVAREIAMAMKKDENVKRDNKNGLTMDLAIINIDVCVERGSNERI